MGIWEWTAQNVFNLLSAAGIVGGLVFTARSMRSETKTRRIGNLLTISANHRDVWKEFSHNPALARVLDASVDPIKQPISHTEEMFVSMVIFHINSVYYAMKDDLVVELDGLQRDVSEFLALPIPKEVWSKIKVVQNTDFVVFVESFKNPK